MQLLGVAARQGGKPPAPHGLRPYSRLRELYPADAAPLRPRRHVPHVPTTLQKRHDVADGATYHWQLRTVSRAQGASAVGKAAYQSGSRLEDPRRAEPHDYRRRARGVVVTGIVLPEGALPELRDRQTLWQSAEAVERHPRAVTARRLIVALPCALDDAARQTLVTDYAAWLASEYGMAVDYAVHRPHGKHRAVSDAADVPGGDQRNHHAHILVTSRRVTADGFGTKTRELDDRKTGAAHIECMRSMWAAMINSRLAAAGAVARVDHRSKERIAAARGELAEPPAPQLTAGELAAERAGRQTHRGDRWRQHRQDRKQLREVRRQHRAAERNARSLRLAETEALTRVADASTGPDASSSPSRPWGSLVPTPRPTQEAPHMLELLIPDPSRHDAERHGTGRTKARSATHQRWRKDVGAYLAGLAEPAKTNDPLESAFSSALSATRAMYSLTGTATTKVANRLRRTVAIASPQSLSLHDSVERTALRAYMAGNHAGQHLARPTRGDSER